MSFNARRFVIACALAASLALAAGDVSAADAAGTSAAPGTGAANPGASAVAPNASAAAVATNSRRVSVMPKGHYAALDALPDWGGAWFASFTPGEAPPAPPKLKGVYLAAYEKWRKEVAAKDGVATSQSNCLPPGMPSLMSLPQYPIEFIFSPGRVTVHHEAWMQWRNIYTDGRKHDAEVDPTFQGSSVGHWEGGTLVVDTIGIKENLGLTSGTRGPVPAHSPKLRVIERIYVDPKNSDTLIDDVTLEDPDALAEPYKQRITYRRDPEQQLLEFVCAENDRNPVDAHGNSTFTHE